MVDADGLGRHAGIPGELAYADVPHAGPGRAPFHALPASCLSRPVPPEYAEAPR